MANNTTYDSITTRLREAGINTGMLDDASLAIISSYIGKEDNCSAIASELSVVESRFAQLRQRGNDARDAASSDAAGAISVLQSLTNSWRGNSLLRDFTFSFSDSECSFMLESFSRACAELRDFSSSVADDSVIAAESAAGMRACATASAEIASNARLAAMAECLNRNRNAVAECNALAVRARASGAECERAASRYLGLTRSCTAVISLISGAVNEAAAALRTDARMSGNTKINVLSPIRAAAALNNAAAAAAEIDFSLR